MGRSFNRSTYLFFLLSVSLGVGCSTLSAPPTIKSGLDGSYRFSRWKKQSSYAESPGVHFYQSILRQALSSRCTLFPNDSAYNQSLHARCGTGVAVLKSMARFFLEPDAPQLNLAIIEKPGILLREDLPTSCHLF